MQMHGFWGVQAPNLPLLLFTGMIRETGYGPFGPDLRGEKNWRADITSMTAARSCRWLTATLAPDTRVSLQRPRTRADDNYLQNCW